MNKYQEALYRQKENIKKLREKEFVEYATDFKLLQELVDKETPMKPTITQDEEFEWYDIFDGKRFWCPKCVNELCCPLQRGITRCDECGQRIDWGDTND